MEPTKAADGNGYLVLHQRYVMSHVTETAHHNADKGYILVAHLNMSGVMDYHEERYTYISKDAEHRS